ncbi:hypothetical protein [Vallitalea maricola]|uniref:Uncharacterized protein n=1 Tax=Vallitalea maricola TaxID=3074433 RepID=A0ACB5UM68_9FIRM|nr:hypothetical protein AN2V17_31990 [Vallitalea sp. AN17-2]
MKKKYYLIFIPIILFLLIYSLRVNTNLNKMKETYDNKQKMIMNDHILSFNIIGDLYGDEILETEFPQIEIQNIINALKKADISNMHLFEDDSLDISKFYREYTHLLEQYKMEQIREGVIEEEQKFKDVINDLNIIKGWLEDRYHDDNYQPYTYQELKEQLNDKLKYANFE